MLLELVRRGWQTPCRAACAEVRSGEGGVVTAIKRIPSLQRGRFRCGRSAAWRVWRPQRARGRTIIGVAVVGVVGVVVVAPALAVVDLGRLDPALGLVPVDVCFEVRGGKRGRRSRRGRTAAWRGLARRARARGRGGGAGVYMAERVESNEGRYAFDIIFSAAA